MNEYNSSKEMPRFPEPYWRDSEHIRSFPPLNESIHVDAAIVGAGISGITTAYLLAREGLKVAVLDASKILNGTTGHTTAKLTAQHDLIYDELISHFGQEKAKLYYQANHEALQFVKHLVQTQGIHCDFIEQDAYLYATSHPYVKKLETELKAYEQLGITGEMQSSIPFPIDITGALVMKQQAQFHPLKYLSHLIQEITALGGMFYENTTAVNVLEGERPKVMTRNGHTVTCNVVVSCTHFPFFGGGGQYHLRMHADRSYALAVKTAKEYPGGMYLSVDSPVRSLRYTPFHDERLVIIGGESHRSGQHSDTLEHYKALQAFAEEVLGIKEFAYRWSTQDLITLDKVPYIGHLTAKHKNIFVATGYRKWGMTHGTAAGLILRDLITKGTNPYEELYAPSRFQIDPDLKEGVRNNTVVAGHLIAGKLDFTVDKAEDLANDEGTVIRVNGQRAGAYRDTQGKLHVVDTTCTHMGCELNWNNGERTWDCPCHGSRFSYDGHVVEGPAKDPLKKLDL